VASELLKPSDARLMRCYPVSTRINHVANDDEGCSRPVEIAEIRGFPSHKGWFLPLPQNLVERLIIPERDDIACQDHDISVHCRGNILPEPNSRCRSL
jgi:hypothetical protein